MLTHGHTPSLFTESFIFSLIRLCVLQNSYCYNLLLQDTSGLVLAPIISSSIFDAHIELLTIIWETVLVLLREVGITGDESMSSIEFIGTDLFKRKGQ